jgi:type IX secretion system PorP/SprF family membrane protein
MVENTKIDLNGIYFGIDPNDPNKGPIDPKSDPLYQSLLSTGSAYTNLNIRAGFLLYTSRYYFGFSYLPLANIVIQDNETDLSASYYRGVIQAGYSFPISATTDIKPSVLALWQDDNKFIIDYNVKVYIDQKIWFGLTYRDVKSMVGIIGFNLNEKLGASYSYELSANNLHQFGGGSHELVLSLRLNNFKRQRQLTW